MRYVGGMDEKGDVIDVRDPLAEKLRRSPTVRARPPSKVAALLSVREVFPEQIAGEASGAGDASLSKPLLRRARAARFKRF